MTLNFTPDQTETPIHHPQIKSLPIHQAADLTQGGSLANIQLGEQLYTLRITRAGKLILTK